MAEHDRRRLIAVFQEQYSDLVRFLTRQLGNEHRAADVAQDVYLRLASGPAPVEEIGDPRAYFFRVARNLAIGLPIHEKQARPPVIREPVAVRATYVDGLGLFHRQRDTLVVAPLVPTSPAV